MSDIRELLSSSPELVEAIEAIENGDECFGVCDAGRVRGAHLANHTKACARLQLMLGQPIPEDYEWNGEKLVYTQGAPGEEDV